MTMKSPLSLCLTLFFLSPSYAGVTTRPEIITLDHLTGLTVDFSATTVQPPPRVVSPLTASVNDFSVSLFNRLSHENAEKNVFVSPFSVSTALSILLLGARTTSEEELTTGLRFNRIDTNEKSVHQLFKELLNESIGNGSSVSVANYMLVQKGGSGNDVLQKYKNDVQTLYGAQVDDVNFGVDSGKIQSDVNNWVKNQTRGLIQSILDSPPDPATFAMILNAIYFKGEWEQKFSSINTQRKVFFNKGANEKETDFMVKLKKHFPYKEVNISGEEIQVLEMAYEADDMSMVILLPRQNDSLKRILSSNNFASDMGSIIANLNKGLEHREMNLFIPKFKMETDYPLIPVLNGMGIRKVTSPGQADLSGVNGQRDLFVSQIKHKAVVKVDEDGTEAAATTMLDMYPMSAQWPYVPPVDFKADHPFVFMIRNKATGLVLFIGKVEEL